MKQKHGLRSVFFFRAQLTLSSRSIYPAGITIGIELYSSTAVVPEEDTVHPAGVRDLGGVGRGDGEVLRRVRAAQEVAQEREMYHWCAVR